jgi:hypothetical protein
MPTARIAAGSTTPGEGWTPYNGTKGIYIDVDTSAAHFTGTPLYVTSVAGDSGNWALVGPSAVYFATATGFRVYVQWRDGSPITPAHAQQYGWHINWIGYDNP